MRKKIERTTEQRLRTLEEAVATIAACCWPNLGTDLSKQVRRDVLGLRNRKRTPTSPEGRMTTVADEKVRDEMPERVWGRGPSEALVAIPREWEGATEYVRADLLARVEAERDAERARAERWRAVADSLHSACGILVIGKPLRDLDERFCFYDKAAESDATERQT